MVESQTECSDGREGRAGGGRITMRRTGKEVITEVTQTDRSLVGVTEVDLDYDLKFTPACLCHFIGRLQHH